MTVSKRKSKSGSRKGKSKRSKERDNKSNLSQEKENSQKSVDEYIAEKISESSVEKNENIDINTLENNYTNTTESKTETSDTNTTESTTETSSDDTNDCCEEINAKQQEILNKIRNLSEALIAITLIRDNVNSLRVDTLTELYFTRQVRPLLDALNIFSFAVANMSTAADNIQTNTFGDRAEIRHALKLSYKMNDEVDVIISALGRRVKIFIDLVDNMDKNCPPFDFKRDS